MAIALLIVLGLVVTVVLARLRWRAVTDDLARQLDAESTLAASPTVIPQESGDLPAPVVRYFEAALGSEQGHIAATLIHWRGDFLLRPESNGWRRFRATQVFQTHPPGFVWDARIQMMPGLDVFVRDAFVDGVGSMRGAVLGIIPVVDIHGTPEIAAGALQRYLGEAVWFPTALLPESGVQWTALDDSSARATLAAGGTSVSLDFRFRADGLVESMYSPSRFRDVDGTAVPTPWEARVSQYVERDGVRVPGAGEVTWLLPEGRLPYWRGQLVDVAYTRELD